PFLPEEGRQGIEYIAFDEDEAVHPGRPVGRLLGAGVAGEDDGARSGLLQLRCQLHDAGRVLLVGRADDCDLRAALRKVGGRRVDVVFRLAGPDLEAPSLEEVHGVGLAGDLIGDRADAGEEDARLVTLARGKGVAGVAQLLESLVEGVYGKGDGVS